MITIHTTDDGRTPAFLRLPCGEITPKSGMLLKVVEGKLAVATADDEPTYISVTERETACADGEEITVTRVGYDMTLITETPENFLAVTGDKVQIGDDGVTITDQAGGPCEIVTTDDERTTFRIVPVEASAVSEETPGEETPGEETT